MWALNYMEPVSLMIEINHVGSQPIILYHWSPVKTLNTESQVIVPCWQPSVCIMAQCQESCTSFLHWERMIEAP